MDSEINLNKKLLKATIHNDLEYIQNLKIFYPEIHWRNIRQPASGETVLHIAAAAGYLDLIKFFLKEFETESGMINIKSNNGSTPLHVAAQHSQYLVVEYLASNGAHLNPLRIGDWTPLALACTKSGDNANRCVSILTKFGASIEFRNKDGWTPMMVACRTGDAGNCRSLKSDSISQFTTLSENRRLPLHIACYHGHLEVVKEIYKKFYDDRSNLINLRDCCGTTPFMDAIFSGNVELVKYLAENPNTDIEESNNEGWNGLHIAASVCKTEMCEYLITQLNFNVNSLDKRLLTPLHCAARSKSMECIDLLLRLGADENLQDWQGRTYKDYCNNFKG